MPRLSLAVTESGAATFTTAAQVTGLEGQTTVAFSILEATFELNLNAMLAATPDFAAFALCRQTKAAMPTVDDVDVMYKFSSGTTIATYAPQSQIIEWKPTRTILIVEDPIHLMIAGISAPVAGVLTGELFYEVVSISAIDRLTLLTQSLSGA